jgi:hypothetical protein
VAKLSVTAQAVEKFFDKIITQFCKQVTPDSPKSTKTRLQLTEEAARDTMRICCLWLSLQAFGEINH